MELSDEERERLLEESRQKAQWDYNSRMKAAYKKDYHQAVQNSVLRDIVRLYSEMGLSLTQIAEKTGLTPEEIGRLRYAPKGCKP